MDTKFNFDHNSATLTYNFFGRMDGINTKNVEKTVHDVFTKISEEMSSTGGDKGDLKIVFDLKDVDFVASSFIRVCLFVAKKISQSNFSITNTSPHVNRTFKVSGLDKALNVS